MMKRRRRRWRGHVIRMTKNAKKNYEIKPEGKRGVGKHEVRWIGVLNNDMRKACVRNRGTEATNRD
jgi:hypothetical protein